MSSHDRNLPTAKNLAEAVSEAILDFGEVATLAHSNLSSLGIKTEIALKPHKSPKDLPLGQFAIYAFFLNRQALKIGKVGPKSVPRYTSQHYNPASSRSNLAKSILANASRVGAVGIDQESAGDWIRTNTDRVNLLLPATVGGPTLSLLEAFLHVRRNPIFEGRSEGE